MPLPHLLMIDSGSLALKFSAFIVGTLKFIRLRPEYLWYHLSLPLYFLEKLLPLILAMSAE